MPASRPTPDNRPSAADPAADTPGRRAVRRQAAAYLRRLRGHPNPLVRKAVADLDAAPAAAASGAA